MSEHLLRAENDELRERVRQLEGLLNHTVYLLPKELGLTRTEETVLSSLLAHPTMTRDHAMHALYNGRGDAEPDVKIIDIYVSRLRKKLKDLGIEIKTEWGRGYSLVPASKAIIQKMLTPEPVA